jgi:hypothetical protein
LPKLNEVIFGFLADDKNLAEGHVKLGGAFVRVVAEKYVNKIC